MCSAVPHGMNILSLVHKNLGGALPSKLARVVKLPKPTIFKGKYA